ncbi:MAG: hypothetical protein IIW98_03590, partial [Bacteroidaceae bacterium]|nr:hypothetical protein [Bacteroidaceae bacterium]
MIPRLMNYFFAALFFVILTQNANAQEMVFHMIGNQTAKYCISQLDSVTFSTQEMVLYLNDNQIAEYSSLQLDS